MMTPKRTPLIEKRNRCILGRLFSPCTTACRPLISNLDALWRAPGPKRQGVQCPVWASRSWKPYSIQRHIPGVTPKYGSDPPSPPPPPPRCNLRMSIGFIRCCYNWSLIIIFFFALILISFIFVFKDYNRMILQRKRNLKTTPKNRFLSM